MIITWISIWLFIATIAFIRINYIISTLVDKINKQQEQMSEDFEYINERLNRHLELFECMTQVSQDIATKVVDIEKRVDEIQTISNNV